MLLEKRGGIPVKCMQIHATHTRRDLLGFIKKSCEPLAGARSLSLCRLTKQPDCALS